MRNTTENATEEIEESFFMGMRWFPLRMGPDATRLSNDRSHVLSSQVEADLKIE
jgi:hypothetical protein